MKYEGEAERAVEGSGDSRGRRAKGQEKGKSQLEPRSCGNATETPSTLCELRWKFLEGARGGVGRG